MAAKDLDLEKVSSDLLFLIIYYYYHLLIVSMLKQLNFKNHNISLFLDEKGNGRKRKRKRKDDKKSGSQGSRII